MRATQGRTVDLHDRLARATWSGRARLWELTRRLRLLGHHRKAAGGCLVASPSAA